MPRILLIRFILFTTCLLSPTWVVASHEEGGGVVPILGCGPNAERTNAGYGVLLCRCDPGYVRVHCCPIN